MKKILLTLAACLFVIVSCEKIDSLLDTKNYQKADTSSFPMTEKDAEQLVNSTYYSMYTFYNGSIFRISLFRNMIASDDVYGHGSESSTETSAADRFLEISGDETNSPWEGYYKGIHRCNFAIEAISAMDDALFKSDNKAWFLGQSHFMRGFFLWVMAQRHETFPLTLSAEVENLPNASVDEIYAAIAEDLTEAIKLIPAKYGYSRETNQAGRATKYAAEASDAQLQTLFTDIANTERFDYIVQRGQGRCSQVVFQLGNKALCQFTPAGELRLRETVADSQLPDPFADFHSGRPLLSSFRITKQTIKNY